MASKRADPPKTWLRHKWTIKEAYAKGVEFCPSNPQNLGMGTQSYEFTLHHNIPLNTIIESFNIVIVFCDWKVTERLLRLYGIDTKAEQIAKRIEQISKDRSEKMSAQNEKVTYKILMSKFKLDNYEFEGIEQRVTWQPWNIVEGPSGSIRADDPKEKFDNFIEADPSNWARYAVINRLYLVLADLIKDYKQKETQPADFENMRKWSFDLKQVLPSPESFIKSNPMVTFNQAHWRVASPLKSITYKVKYFYAVRKRVHNDPEIMLSPVGRNKLY
ncbi:MAG: hypothetical protein WCK96_10180 [Methylococcales bacterium]